MKVKIKTEQIIKLYNNGLSLNYISNKIGLSVGAIHSRLKWNNVSTRSYKEGIKLKFPNGRFGILSSNYKDGRVNNTKCIDCSKILKRWQDAKRCKSCARKFQYKDPSTHPSWKGGITPIHIAIRNLQERKQWSFQVFKRDNFTCKICGDNKGGNLEADHIKPFSKILKRFLKKYNQFSPIEDKETLLDLAVSYKAFWDISNGRTLCHDCHIQTETYGRKAVTC